MEENEKGFYTAVEKEILILVDTIRDIIHRTKMDTLNPPMISSIEAQITTDREAVRRYAAKRNKVKYEPQSPVIIEELKDLTDQAIEEMYEQMEGVYFSLIKFEQALKN